MLNKFLVLAGILFFAIGAVGVVVPVLPTTPLLLLSGVCFTKGSSRFDAWLKGTRLYNAYVGDYLETRTIPLKKKYRIALNIYILMGISIYFVPLMPVKILLLLLTAGLTVMLFFFIPTRD